MKHVLQYKVNLSPFFSSAMCNVVTFGLFKKKINFNLILLHKNKPSNLILICTFYFVLLSYSYVCYNLKCLIISGI